MSNLLEKASIITTPTAYDNGKLLSVKGGTVADFDFSRGSSATRVNSQGLIEDVQIIGGELVQNGDFSQEGAELVTNGGFDTDSNWTKGSNTTIANGKATTTGTGAFGSVIYQSISLVSGKFYKISIDIEKQSGSQLIARWGSQNAIASLNSTGTFTNYFEANSTGSQLLNIFEQTGGDFVGSIDNVSVVEVGQNWNTQGDWSIGDGVAQTLAPLDFDSLTQNITLTAGKKYRISLNATKTSIGGQLILRDLNLNGVTNLDNYTTIDYTYQNNNNTLYILGFQGWEGTITDISVKEITDDTDIPRIDYTGGVGHILLEPQSTNGVDYSEDFTQANRLNNGTITSNDVTSPDGTQNASKFTITASTPYFSPSHPGFTSGTVYTMSCFVKKGTQRWVRLANVSSSSTGAWFDLDNNVVGTTKAAVISATITNYGNGWYRVASTLTAANTNNNNFLGLSDDDGGTNVDSGNFGNTVYFWGFQIQEQNVLTSYIPTNGAAVTRSTEACNNSGNSDSFNDSEGVLYAEIKALGNYNTQRFLGISDGSDTDKVILGFNNSATNYIIVAETKSGGSTTSFMTYDLGTAAPTFLKVALKYKANDFALWVDGTERATDSSGAAPVGLSELAFDRGNGANDFEGQVKCVAVYKEALTDAELQCLTT